MSGHTARIPRFSFIGRDPANSEGRYDFRAIYVSLWQRKEHLLPVR